VPAKPTSAATALCRAPQKSWSSGELAEKFCLCANANTATMFENLCAIPLESDLFAQAIHPSEPIVAVGLASGHVQAYRLPAGASDDSDPDETLASESGFGHIETAWSTRRHKGSCRTLAYSVDGLSLYSAGTDGIVKVADCATGRVTAKIAVPYDA
jgi:hypothetical protein